MDDLFAVPYIPNTEEERRQMLEAIGVASAEDLFQDIPQEYRAPVFDLPPPLSEMELRREMEGLSRKNWSLQEHPSFLGGGAYRHFVPSAVRHLLNRGEFTTCYTPYQPEVSQGTLQVAYDFQSLICQLTGMEVANSGMYDGASALAEAALMACRITGRGRVAARDTLSPYYREVLGTYTSSLGIVVDVVPAHPLDLNSDTACLLVQHPNFFGYLEDLAYLESLAHQKGALFVVSVDPIALGLFRPPGDYNADIVVGEAQPLGIPLSFGGPYLGFFACKEQHLRQMPGRIVGKTTDERGRTGYVLTLQTREQHIRRERATSNICTSEALMLVAVTAYLALMGPQGLRQVAWACYHKAHYAASLLAQLPGYSLPLQGVFFKEFVIRCPVPPASLNERLLERGILGGLDISSLIPNGWLLCVTEMNTRQEIHMLRDILAGVQPRTPEFQETTIG